MLSNIADVIDARWALAAFQKASIEMTSVRNRIIQRTAIGTISPTIELIITAAHKTLIGNATFGSRKTAIAAMLDTARHARNGQIQANCRGISTIRIFGNKNSPGDDVALCAKASSVPLASTPRFMKSIERIKKARLSKVIQIAAWRKACFGREKNNGKKFSINKNMCPT